jgi:hypothetical protein
LVGVTIQDGGVRVAAEGIALGVLAVDIEWVPERAAALGVWVGVTGIAGLAGVTGLEPVPALW